MATFLIWQQLLRRMLRSCFLLAEAPLQAQKTQDTWDPEAQSGLARPIPHIIKAVSSFQGTPVELATGPIMLQRGGFLERPPMPEWPVW